MNDDALLYLILADGILILHTLFIAFVVFGQLFIVIGLLKKWPLARNLVFRIAHIGAIGFVVLESWIGVTCPLTVWESGLRVKAGEDPYHQDFIAHWLQRLIFYEAPHWVFTTLYTGFGLLVLLTWIFGPPLRKKTGDVRTGPQPQN